MDKIYRGTIFNFMAPIYFIASIVPTALLILIAKLGITGIGILPVVFLILFDLFFLFGLFAPLFEVIKITDEAIEYNSLFRKTGMWLSDIESIEEGHLNPINRKIGAALIFLGSGLTYFADIGMIITEKESYYEIAIPRLIFRDWKEIKDTLEKKSRVKIKNI